MEEENKFDADKFIENLPKPLKDLVFDGAWEERTAEIAKKYSLNEVQTETLINTTLFILIGLEDSNKFIETIIIELGISRLLAEQIMEDLEVRVFEYAVRTIEKKAEKVASSQENKKESFPRQSASSPRQSTTSTEVEIKPDNLPMVEIGEVAHDTARIGSPQKKSDLTQTIADKIADSESSQRQSAFSPRSSATGFEPVQRPFEVPRFTGVPIESNNEVRITNNEKENKIKTEPNKVTPAQVSPKTEPVKQESKKYTVDPYREPIE